MKSSGIPLSALPKRYQDQVGAQLVAKTVAKHGDEGARAWDKPRLRQNAKGPNKTEAAFGVWLANEYPMASLEYEGLTLKLANGSRFTADWFVHHKEHGKRPLFFETKGFMRDDAAVKIKVAARYHLWAEFYLVTKRTKKQGGGWAIERVLP